MDAPDEEAEVITSEIDTSDEGVEGFIWEIESNSLNG